MKHVLRWSIILSSIPAQWVINHYAPWHGNLWAELPVCIVVGIVFGYFAAQVTL